MCVLITYCVCTHSKPLVKIDMRAPTVVGVCVYLCALVGIQITVEMKTACMVWMHALSYAAAAVVELCRSLDLILE